LGRLDITVIDLLDIGAANAASGHFDENLAIADFWNWHFFRTFDTDIASPNFGMISGAATDPRYIQVGAKITF